jgi:hypothetical protein
METSFQNPKRKLSETLTCSSLSELSCAFRGQPKRTDRLKAPYLLMGTTAVQHFLLKCIPDSSAGTGTIPRRRDPCRSWQAWK